MQKIECICTKSSISIDPNSTAYVCGVVGLVEFKNVHIIAGVVTCAERNCGNEIHRQKKGS